MTKKSYHKCFICRAPIIQVIQSIKDLKSILITFKKSKVTIFQMSQLKCHFRSQRTWSCTWRSATSSAWTSTTSDTSTRRDRNVHLPTRRFNRSSKTRQFNRTKCRNRKRATSRLQIGNTLVDTTARFGNISILSRSLLLKKLTFGFCSQ